ncbi:ribosome biogenesis protein Nop16 [Bombardia bombarda]|uniref:Nucleolar protein 16 n=1 Tax=Bombardia bombarda TaxID=252184 RepID=A0AA39WIE9_9PEZI|nr:ribosome biogenesis protein Nop16 [Bombardia bombarda]
MGRELQKRKRRSSRAKVTMSAARNKILNPMGSGIIAKAWNKKETMSQNYSRFGLVAKLGTTAGGVSKKHGAPKDPLVFQSSDQGMLRVDEVKVERDADGKIIRILRSTNPLRDPLNALDSDNEDEDNDDIEDDGQEWAGIDPDPSKRPAVIRELEQEAARPTEKHIRHQSDREREWLERLVAKHGDDTAAMARDPKLNPMQQTKGDLARRLKKAGLL